MKILHTADWHIGNFPGPEKDGENCRLKDTLLCIDELIRVADQECPDLVLISGDIFHQARVWSDRGLSETQLAIGKIQALANVAPVVAMRGTPNHDGEEQFSALSQFFKNAPTRYPVFVAMEPDVLNIPTPHGVAQVATVPGFDRGFFRARFPGISREDECQIFTENLGKIVLTLRARMDAEGTTKILMAHYMVPGCNMESGQAQFFSGVDPIILPETIDGAQYDLIALGHIHRPQQLETCRNAFYSGAVNALNFNDEGQDRGFYLHDTETGEHTFFPTPYRRFLTYDWTDCEITAILNGDIDDVAYHNWKWKVDQPAIIDGAVVRVLYECSAEKDKAFNRALVERRLYEDGAFWVAGISPSNITADVSRKELSEQSAPEANLREYLELKAFSEDEIGRIIEVARPIIARAIASSTNTRLAGVFTPISIEVKNYRNYAEESFDFTGITFCTINGKNGAGKSSLFMDAILDALFEEPREGDLTGWIRAAEGARSGSITFTFRIGEKSYRVCRTRAKSGKATLNLSELVDGQWENRSCEKIRDTQAAIVSLLGMDSLTFRSCALIMQDQYGIFLQADKEARMSILGNILGLNMYSDMEALAREGLGDQRRAIAQAKDRRLRLQSDLTNTEIPNEQYTALEGRIEALEAEKAKYAGRKEELNRVVIAGEAAAAKSKQVEQELSSLRQKAIAMDARHADLQTTISAANYMLSRESEIAAGVLRLEELKRQVAAATGNRTLYNAKLEESARVRQDMERLEADRQNTMAKQEEAKGAIKRCEERLASADRLKEAAAEYDRLQAQISELEEKGTQYEAVRRELEAANQTLSTATASYREEASRRKQVIEGMQKRIALLGDCGCLDIDQAECKFLADAKEAQATLGPYTEECTRWKEQQQAVIGNLTDSCLEVKNRLEALGYDTDVLEQLRKKAALLYAERRALDELPALETQKAALETSVGEYVQRLDDIQLQLVELRKRHAALFEETEALRGGVEALRQLEEQTRGAEHWTAEWDALTAEKERLKNAQERLSELVEQISENAAMTANKERELYELQSALEGYEQDRKAYADNDLALEHTENQLSESRQQLGAYNHRRQEAERLRREIGELDQRTKHLGDLVNVYEVLKGAFSQDGIPHNIIRSILPILSSTANGILGQMTGGRMGMEFVTEKVLKSNSQKEVVTLDILIREFGKDTLPYLSKSGGEKVKASLSAILALAEIKSSQAGIQLGMLFVDEPPFLDQDGTQAYCDALETIQRRYSNIKIMAITHDPTFKARFPQSVDVIKDETGSRVEMS